MRRYALIGNPLDHSFSPAFFQKFFKKEGIIANYNALPLSSLDQLEEAITKDQNLCGFNVTHPYKEVILSLLSSLTEEALLIGASNTVYIHRGRNGYRLHGHNTDAKGFATSLDAQSITATKALILGCGGASNAVAQAFKEKEIAFHRLCRKPVQAQDLPWASMTPSELKDYDLIINATPLGTFPAKEEKPDIPYEGLREGQFLYDLVYNPPLTAFLQEAKSRNLSFCNGLEMLKNQAMLSWEWWKKMERI